LGGKIVLFYLQKRLFHFVEGAFIFSFENQLKAATFLPGKKIYSSNDVNIINYPEEEGHE